VSSLFLFCTYVSRKTQINESFTKFRYSHLLFTFLCVVVGPAEHCGLENFDSPWCVVAMDM
jgi:hypothetical protein